MQSTENPVKIDFIVPQGWHELTDAQLRYVYNLIDLEMSSEEIAVTCLLHWSGTRIIGRQPDGAYLLQQKKLLFEAKPSYWHCKNTATGDVTLGAVLFGFYFFDVRRCRAFRR